MDEAFSDYLFSCAVFMNVALQGFEDISPEELRYSYYNQRIEQNLKHYMKQVNLMKIERKKLRKKLINSSWRNQRQYAESSELNTFGNLLSCCYLSVWPLSCFGNRFTDISPEEDRLHAYNTYATRDFYIYLHDVRSWILPRIDSWYKSHLVDHLTASQLRNAITDVGLFIAVQYVPLEKRWSSICSQYIQKQCKYGKQCPLIHPPLPCPYAWCQISNSDSVRFFKADVNDKIEKCYCDPNSKKYENHELVVDFEVPAFSTYFNKYVIIKRFSTQSIVCDVNDVAATHWKWYWNDVRTWTEYSEKIDTGQCTSDIIESFYMHWLETETIKRYKFHTSDSSYEIDFNSMLQENVNTTSKTTRKVGRRPLYVSNVSERKHLSQMKLLQFIKLVDKAKEFPVHWPTFLTFHGYQLLSVMEMVYSFVENHFKQTMKEHYKIICIEEVCNKEYYSKYVSKKKAMKETCKNINELQLWHGTSHTNIEHICHQNFDCRMCKTCAFGQGCYFARDASYSHTYSDMNHNNIYCMFLADVLVGEYTTGKSSYKRPPEKEKFKLYDSCVNNITNPSIYVIFERDQCYPRYLLKYKRKNAL